MLNARKCVNENEMNTGNDCNWWWILLILNVKPMIFIWIVNVHNCSEARLICRFLCDKFHLIELFICSLIAAHHFTTIEIYFTNGSFCFSCRHIHVNGYRVNLSSRTSKFVLLHSIPNDDVNQLINKKIILRYRYLNG